MSDVESENAQWATPLPATEVNLSRGALWTWFVFAIVIALGVAVILATQASGGPLQNLLALTAIGGFVFIMTLTITVLPEMVIGLPLVILFARLLRTVPGFWPHLAAQFVAGAASAAVTCLVATNALRSGWSVEYLMPFEASVIALIACAGFCSAAGWALALRGHRRRVRAEAAPTQTFTKMTPQ